MPCNQDSDCDQPRNICDLGSPMDGAAGTCVFAPLASRTAPGEVHSSSSSVDGSGSTGASSGELCEPACNPGQRCVEGLCLCDQQSCAGGCCANNVCRLRTFNACGQGGDTCLTCDDERADNCANAGTCRCGNAGECGPGQRCIRGQCECFASTCPGCCLGSVCLERSVEHCGVLGSLCVPCDATRADGCTADGRCACGNGPPCGIGRACVLGNCVCNASSCEGCCEDRVCSLSNMLACGSGGVACQACEPQRSNACGVDGHCACGAGPECGPGQACVGDACVCNGQSCQGCCSGNHCQQGNQDDQCGVAGLACDVCKMGEICQQGVCTNCTAETCPNGCCSANTCHARGNETCGVQGLACQACSTVGADGCGPDGTCLCGTGPACGEGQACMSGSCLCNTASCPQGCCMDGICQSRSVATCGVEGDACTACNTVLADTCSTQGDCQCGGGPACVPGQRCVDGACTCDALSCPQGCCQGDACQEATFSLCGVQGKACAACNPTLADACRSDGQCGCGADPSCGQGQVCSNGQCTCTAESCPYGCCSNGICRVPSAGYCGTAGAPCMDCGLGADGCNQEGDCVCGIASPCAPGTVCILGRCQVDSSSTSSNPGSSSSLESSSTSAPVAPTLTVSAPSVAVVNKAGSVSYTVTYHNATWVGLSAADIQPVNTDAASCPLPSIQGSGVQSRTLTFRGCSGIGSIRFGIRAGTSRQASLLDSGVAAMEVQPFQVDAVPPEVSVPTLRSPVLPVISGATLEWSWTQSDQGLEPGPLSVVVEVLGAGTSVLAQQQGSNLVGMTWPSPVDTLQGSVRLRVSVTDVAGNASQVQSAAVSVKPIPTLSLDAGSLPAYVNGGRVLTGGCQTGLEVVAQGAGLAHPTQVTCVSQRYSTPVDFTSGSGTKVLALTTADADGRINRVDASTVLDDVPPTMTITGPSGSLLLNRDSLPVVFHVAVTGGTLLLQESLVRQVKGNGEDALCMVQITSLGNNAADLELSACSGDGMVGVDVLGTCATDEAGNHPPDQHLDVDLRIDNTPPALTIITPPPGARTPGALQLVGTCEADLETRVWVDGVEALPAFLCGHGTFDVNILLAAPNGNKQIAIAQTDEVGNPGSVGLAVARDSLAGGFTITPAEGNMRGGDRVDVQVADAASVTSILMGGVPCTGLMQVDATTVQCTTGEWNTKGFKDVIVVRDDGSGTVDPGAFRARRMVFVSALGNDANSGTLPTEAWQTTVPVQCGQWEPGDILQFRGGDVFAGAYFEVRPDDDATRCPDAPSSDVGNPADPIIIRSYGTGKATLTSMGLTNLVAVGVSGVTVEDLVFRGDGRESTGALLWAYVGGSQDSIRGFTVRRCEFSGKVEGVGAGTWDDTRLRPIHDVLVEDCIFTDIGRYAAWIGDYTRADYADGYTNIIIRRNIFRDIYHPTLSDGGQPIRVDTASHALVEDNFITGARHNAQGSGFIAIANSTNVLVRRNEIANSTAATFSHGIVVNANSQDTVVEGNYVHDVTSTCLGVQNWEGYRPTARNHVRFNVCIKTAGSGAAVFQSWVGGTGTQNTNGPNYVYHNYLHTTSSKPVMELLGGQGYVFVNNVLHREATSGNIVYLARASDANTSVFRGNAYVTGATANVVRDNAGSVTYATLATWSAATGQETATGTAGDPVIGHDANARNPGFYEEPLSATPPTLMPSLPLSSLSEILLGTTSSLRNAGVAWEGLIPTPSGTIMQGQPLRDFLGSDVAGRTTWSVGPHQP